MSTVRHTFIGRPDAALDTVISGELAQQRLADTAIVAQTRLIAPAPTMITVAAPFPADRVGGTDDTVAGLPSSSSREPRHASPIADLATVIVPSPANADGGGTDRSLIRKSLPIGFVVHRYRIEGIIGEGGFGITYRARDLVIDREVAIKELFVNGTCFRTHANEVAISHPDRNRRLIQWAQFYFSEEARITFAMRHESIVRIYDFFKTNNTAYIVYERLNGADLKVWCDDRRALLDHGQAVELARATATALRHVHQRGFLHRDVKPANIFMTSEGDHPVLIDFGAATAVGSRTGNGEILVTPGFAPPEQYDPTVSADARADIYALCATLYWAMSGKVPPPAPQRVARDDLLPLSTVIDPRFRYGERLYRVIEQGLSLRREDRYPTVNAMLDDLLPKVQLQASGYLAEPLGPRIFVSYRREDSAHFSGRLLDFLEMRFGADAVFIDVQSIPAGTDFWDHIKEILGQCAVVLVIIGPRWLDLLKKRRKWFGSGFKGDYVAQEIAAAIELKVPIIPVMFDNAPMPRDADLPKYMRILTKLNAATFGHGPAFRFAADGIADQITRIRNAVVGGR